MIDTGIEQRTDEWYAARLGKATASRFKDILAKTKSGSEAALRRNYRAQLVVERLTGKAPTHFKSEAMEHGIETEDWARYKYSSHTGILVEPASLLLHDFLQAGASPDGLVAEQRGGIEIKCFNTANHIEAMKHRAMPPEHKPQVQGQAWIADLDWVDFISADPDMPPNAQIFIQRIYRDDAYIDKVLAPEVALFLDEVEAEAQMVSEWQLNLVKA